MADGTFNGRLDVKSWIFLLAAMVTIAAITAGLLSAVYQTRVEASAQVGEFRAHVASMRGREQFLEDMRDEINEQRTLLRTVSENQIRIMERLRIQPVRNPNP